MNLRSSLVASTALLFLFGNLRADPSVLSQIQASYDHALRGQATAKTPEDLDANERLIDTPDWVSIVNDGPPQHWQDVRAGAVAALGHPSDLAIKILKLTISGDRAIVIARVGSPKDVNSAGDLSRTALVRDTWIKTSVGWRRKMHEKPAPGKLEADLK